MKSGEQKVTYWVMYSHRCQRDISRWPEPRNVQWVERVEQHYGTSDLATAERSVADFQKYVETKTHFLPSELSGPDAHHLTEAWIEVEHRCRLEPNAPVIPSITAPQLGANEE